MRFDSKCSFAPPTVLWGFSFALGCGVPFFGGIQDSPVDECSAASRSFGVLAEDEHKTSTLPSYNCVMNFNFKNKLQFHWFLNLLLNYFLFHRA